MASDPLTRGLIVGATLFHLAFTGPITTGLPLLATAEGWGVGGVGLTIGAYGLSGAVTGLLLSAGKTPKHPGRLVAVGAALPGIGFAAIAASSSMLDAESAKWVAVGAGLVTGVGASLIGPLLISGLLAGTPKGEVGKVMAVVEMAAFTTMPISLAGSGFLAELGGSATPFAVGSALLLLTGVGFALYRPTRTMGV